MLDLRKIHENPAFVPCSCEKCRDLRKNMLPQHIPMVQTILNTEGDAYSFDYEVKQGRYEQFLAALKELLAKYPKLLVPVLAAVSELFRPAGFPAVYQFATDSVPAKKLINLLVSLFYDRAYEYDSELKEYDTAGSHQHIGNGWEDHHVMLLDTWDLDKISHHELIDQLLPLSRDQQLSHEQQEESPELYPPHVCMTTYPGLISFSSAESPYPSYCDIFYVNTVYGDDIDLDKDYNRLLQEVKENGYGHMIDDSMCRKLIEAGNLEGYSCLCKELDSIFSASSLEANRALDPVYDIYICTYIISLLCAAKAVKAVWGLDFSMEDVERMLLYSFRFRTHTSITYMYGLTDFMHFMFSDDFHRKNRVGICYFDRPETDDFDWVTDELIMTPSTFFACAEKVSELRYGTRDPKYVMEFHKFLKHINMLEEDGYYIISNFDFDVTAESFE